MGRQGEIRERIRASLEKYISASGYTQKEIAEKLGVSKSSITNWLKGKNSPDANLVMPICKLLNITVGQFYGEDEPFEEKNDAVGERKAPSLSDEAMKLAEDYDGRMDDRGRETVRGVADLEVARFKSRTAAALRKSREQSEAAEEIAPPIPLHQPYAQIAAAEGAGAFLLDDGFDEVLVEMNKYTKQADVILKVVGRSMEPVITDGDRGLVRQQPSVRIGEIGVFIVDGQGYLKEYQADRLVSLNPDIDDVLVGDLQSAECYGKFIKVLNPDWVK